MRTRGGGSGSSRRGRGEDCKKNGSNHAVTTINEDNDNTNDRCVSYAQLSALLALSAEKNPSTATSVGGTSSNSGNSNGNHNKDTELSIGQALCQKLLCTITQYSNAHSLDRLTEVAKFLNPVERQCRQRNKKAALCMLLPAYASYTVSLLTGNPLLLLIGIAALSVKDTMVEETASISGFGAAGGRMVQLETACLLDKCNLD
jgi:hypothetical protein